jgi:hypothetical protein
VRTLISYLTSSNAKKDDRGFRLQSNLQGEQHFGSGQNPMPV